MANQHIFIDIASATGAVDPYRVVLEGLDENPSNIIFVPILIAERIPFLRSDAMILDLKYAMNENSIVYRDVVMGGGLSKYGVVVKILANVLDKRVVVSDIPDVTHIGNTITALISLENWSTNMLELLTKAHSKKVVEPNYVLVSHYSCIKNSNR